MKDRISENPLLRQSSTSSSPLVQAKQVPHHSSLVERMRPSSLLNRNKLTRKAHRCGNKTVSSVVTAGRALRGLKHSYARRGRASEIRTVHKPSVRASPLYPVCIVPQYNDGDDDVEDDDTFHEHNETEESDHMQEDANEVKPNINSVGISLQDNDIEDNNREDENVFAALAQPIVKVSQASFLSDSEEDDESSVDLGEVENQKSLQASSVRVSLSPHVHFSHPLVSATVTIPSHRDYDEKDKARIWTDLDTLREEANRNRIEWSWECYELTNVPEEDQFRNDMNGNLLHPAHWSTEGPL